MDAEQCTKCGEVKGRNEFHKNSRRKSGLQPACKICMAESKRAWYLKNKKRINESNKAWYEANRERRNETGKAYYQNNVAAKQAATRKYQAVKRQRSPSWANDQLIAAYYKEAKRLEELTGIQFHVDHIIPLQGELVSGLHVETNLQLLPAHENLGKSNSFDPMTFCA